VRFGDLFQLSLENLWRTKLRSGLTTLGVIIGIGVLVSMVSFGTGVQKNVTDQLRENDLFTSMEVLPTRVDLEDVMSGNFETPDEDAPPLDDEVLRKIGGLPGVEIAYPDIRFPVKIRLGEREARTNLRAIPASMGAFKPLSEIPFGRFFETDDEPSVVLSRKVLQNLDIRLADAEEPAAAGETDDDELVALPSDSLLGREVEIISSVLDRAGLVQGFAMGMRLPSRVPLREETVTLTVVGIQTLPTGFGGDRLQSGILVPVTTAQSIPRLGFNSIWEVLGRSGEGEGYPSLYVRVQSMEDLEPVREAVEEMGFGVIAIADQLEEIKRQFLILDTLLGAVGTVALIVASLGIINTMVTSILERKREIGVMKAIGGSETDIRMIFFVEAATVGVLGGILGLVLGWGVTRIANAVANHYLRPQGFAPVDLFYVPAWLLLGAIAFAVVVSLLAGVYPAMRAARVDPVQALRHD
jgi:putative ABC transport system permease protein